MSLPFGSGSEKNYYAHVFQYAGEIIAVGPFGTKIASQTLGQSDDVVIQAAINHMKSEYGGGTVRIKKGSTHYSIFNSMTHPSNTTIESDAAILRAAWASDYLWQVNNVRYAPIFYNENYSAGASAYGQNSKLTIRGLILQGRDGTQGGVHNGSIPLRYAGVDDLLIDHVYIDNSTLASGTANAQMAQAAIGIDLYNRRVKIIKPTIVGGWAGIYMSGVNNVSIPTDQLPTVAKGTNQRVIIQGGHIEVGGDSNPITPGFCMDTIIDGTAMVFNNDNCIDASGYDGMLINGVTMRGTDNTKGRAINLGSNPSRDVTVLNCLASDMQKGIGTQVNMQKGLVIGFVCRNMTGVGIDGAGNPADVVNFIGCDLSGSTGITPAANINVVNCLSAQVKSLPNRLYINDISFSTNQLAYKSSGFGVGPIQPSLLARLLVKFGGMIYNDTINDGVQLRIYRSTVGIPAGGAAPAGGDVQVFTSIAYTSLAANNPTGVGPQILDTGLNRATQYYYYVAIQAITAGNANVQVGSLTVEES